MTTSGDLLDAAEHLAASPPADLIGRWPRAVALLSRQSLEAAIDEYWADRAPEIGASRAWRPKLLCLEAYLNDADLGREVYETWGTLSHACHVHAYDLDPTLDELRGWLQDVSRVNERLANTGAAES